MNHNDKTVRHAQDPCTQNPWCPPQPRNLFFQLLRCTLEKQGPTPPDTVLAAAAECPEGKDQTDHSKSHAFKILCRTGRPYCSTHKASATATYTEFLVSQALSTFFIFFIPAAHKLVQTTIRVRQRCTVYELTIVGDTAMTTGSLDACKHFFKAMACVGDSSSSSTAENRSASKSLRSGMPLVQSQ